MENLSLTVKSYFKTLNLIYIAMVAGQIIFGLVAYFLLQSTKFESEFPDMRDVFIYIVPIFVLGGIFGSTAVFTKTIFNARSLENLSDKLIEYRSALVMKYALLEGPSFFAIVIYLLTGDTVFLGMAGLILMVFILNRPGIAKAEMDLALDADEKLNLENPNHILG